MPRSLSPRDTTSNDASASDDVFEIKTGTPETSRHARHRGRVLGDAKVRSMDNLFFDLDDDAPSSDSGLGV